MFSYIAAIALFITPAIAVPWTNATCTSQDWSCNSRGQIPCLVAAFLGAQCTTDNTFGIYALDDGGPYGFVASAANNCFWGQWVASCPTNLINIGKYPLPLPAGVAVPSWAYYNFTTSSNFDRNIALQQLGLESSAISGATSTPAPAPNPTVAPLEASTATGATSAKPLWN